MPQHVLLGASPVEILKAVQLGLESSGHVVRFASDVEGVVGAARSKGVDLVIVAEPLSGGTGSDVCLILQDLPGGHAPLLYVGDLLVPGADAFAPPGDPARILEQARSLLEGAELIDSLGDMQKPAPVPPKAAPGGAMPWNLMPTPATPPPPDPTPTPTPEPTPKPAPPPTPTITASARPAPAVDPEDPPRTRKTPAAKPGTNGASPKDKAFFDALLKKVREADYFEILGVTQEATADDVRAAHESIHASLRGLGTSVPRLQLEETKDAVDEARDVLCEPALRAAYTRNRP